jgi:2-desacetyl-2-hydroxyethyl bacteriochlorophyllide A dehydrogenase
MKHRHSLYFLAPYEVAIRQELVPSPGRGEVLVRSAVSAISAGTELLFYRDQVPRDLVVDATIDGLDKQVSYPLKYGYAVVGRVISLGPDVDNNWLGRMVFVFHSHESHFATKVSNLHPVPQGLAAETAVFLPLMETAVSFLMDGQPMIGEQVALFGQGIVGLLTTSLLADYPLASLITLDPFPLRREWSLKLGAQATLDPGEVNVLERLKTLLQGKGSYEGADLAFELSGNPQALDQAIAITGYDGRLLIGSWYGQKPVALALGGRFHRSHMRLISSQVSYIAPRWRGRFDHVRRLKSALSLLAKQKPDRLITHRFPIDQASQAYQLLDQHPESVVQVVFTYDNSDFVSR